MNLLGKLFKNQNKKVDLKGDGNVVIQSSDTNYNFQFNIRNEGEVNAFFENFSNYLPEIKLYLNSNKEEFRNNEIDRKQLLEIVNEKIVFDQFFKYKKPVSDVSEKDIFDIRISSFREAYFGRKYDDEVFDMVQKGENVLIIGNSLSGKTRAFYELVKKLKEFEIDAEVLFPKMVSGSSSFDFLRYERKQIVFFDDIDDYYNKLNIDNFIIELIKSGFQIIATCRTGPEYKDFKMNSSSKIREVFSIIEIEKIKRELIDEFAENENIDIENSEFDGNIGSIILPIHQMRLRYEKLKYEDDKINKLSINFLKALKALYTSSNFYTKSKYDFEKTVDFCMRFTIGRHASSNLTSSDALREQLLKIKRKMDEKNIEEFLTDKDKALKNLQSDDVNLNFIDIDINRKFLRIEEVYLEKIVRYHPIQVIKDINNLYGTAEKNREGFYVKTSKFNQLISASDSYEKAKSIFSLMKKEGIKPNPDTFSELIKKCETYLDAEGWFNLAVSSNSFNVSLFGEIIKISPDFDAAINYLEEFFKQSERIFNFSNKAVYWVLECLTKTKSHGFNLKKTVGLFEEYNIPFSSGIFINLIQRANSLEESYEVLEKAKETKIILDSSVFEHLLHKVRSVAEGYEVLEKAKQAHITLYASTFDSWIQKANSLEEGYEVLKKAKEARIALDTSIFNRLIEKASSVAEGYEVLEKAKEARVTLDAGIFDHLMQKANSLAQGYEVLEKAKEARITLDAGIFVNLMQKASSLAEGYEVLEKAKEARITLDAGIFVNLMQKASSLAEGYEVLEKAKQARLTLNAGIFDHLMQKANSLAQGYEVLEKAKQARITLDAGIFLYLIQKASSLAEGCEVLEKAKEARITLDVRIFDQLMQKANSLAQGYEVLEKAKQARLTLDAGIFLYLMQKAGSLAEGYEVLEKAEKEGVSLDYFISEKSSSLEDEYEGSAGGIRNMNDLMPILLARGLKKYRNLDEAQNYVDKYDLTNELPIFDFITNNLEKCESWLEKIKAIANLGTSRSVKTFAANRILNEMIKSGFVQTKEISIQIQTLMDSFKIDIYDDVKEILENI